MASDLEAYLSAGLTMGALRAPTEWRGASLGFGASLGTATTCCCAVAERHRIAGPLWAWGDGFAGCRADARPLLLQTRLAIFGVRFVDTWGPIGRRREVGCSSLGYEARIFLGWRDG